MMRPSTAPAVLARPGHPGGLRAKLDFNNSRSSQKLFVVAVDGTNMSLRAVRLVAWLLDASTRDRVRCISVADKDKGKVAALEDIKNAELILRDCGVSRMAIVPGEVLTVAEHETVVEALNRAACGGHLVLGSSGQRRPEGGGKRTLKNDPVYVGSVSLQCMALCSAPVILCKPKATPLLDTVKGMQSRLDGRAGTVIIVPVDGTRISQKSFDMALRFVKRGDDIHVVFIRSGDRSVSRVGENNPLIGDSAVEKYYKQECEKAAMRFSGSSFAFHALPLKKGSVTDTIIDYTEDVLADLIIMGSAELAKAHQMRSPGQSPRKDNIALGSVSAAVARKTQAHIIIAKHFAT